MTRMKTTKFDKWFGEQFGCLPDPEEWSEAEKKSKALRGELENCEFIIETQKVRAQWYRAALYAWQARGGNRGGVKK